MAGNKLGGRKAARVNREKYDGEHADVGGFYGYIGTLGGSKVTPNTKLKGFGTHRALASVAGRKGGRAGARTQ